MRQTEKITLNFSNGYHGEVIAPRGTLNIGTEENTFAPYNLLYGALGSCYYATFLSMAKKMKLDIIEAKVVISGEKKDDDIATLAHVLVDVQIKSPSDEKKLIRSAELGAKYCSIYNTISQIAEMELKIEILR
ncbi:MAG: OsmC family protein [Bacilli bacterium]|jgi:putative redox protein|nr:OsmC family protein [Bacilli bacterium]MDD3121514.1 OsmC family protein [Bacilli bacterium]MDD4062785.1 OsmC family protein [Bacilli bacterium]MDD4482260.1 OsmC family protein [Bacilli bacterium]MDD5182767.1 OsmC family protein [Bacilli bacterium]